jgi:hypothetical protein
MRFNSPAWDLGAAEIVRPRTRDFVDTCQLAEVIATRTRLTWSFAYIEKAQSENEDYTLKEDSGFNNLSEGPPASKSTLLTAPNRRGALVKEARSGTAGGGVRIRKRCVTPRGRSGATISAI